MPGPLAYRQGKPMRPDVARAFDRMAAAARRDGVDAADHLRLPLRRRAGAAVRRSTRTRTGSRRPATRCTATGPSSTSARRPRTAGSARNAAPLPLHPALRVGAVALRLRRSTRARLPTHGAAVAATAAARCRRSCPARLRASRSRARRAAGTSRPRCSRRSSTRSRTSTRSRSAARARAASPSSCPARRAPTASPTRSTPAASIDAQAHLMRDLLRQFGSVSLALAAYNAGAGAGRALRLRPAVSGDAGLRGPDPRPDGRRGRAAGRSRLRGEAGQLTSRRPERGACRFAVQKNRRGR